MGASALLPRFLDELQSASNAGPILDLACGEGRNGLYLLQNNLPVVFADMAPKPLQTVRNCLESATYRQHRHLARVWQADFELSEASPLRGKAFGAILVFRYLHRALIPDIRMAVCPGGIVIYETFTVDQAQYGRPKNPDYLLRKAELLEFFAGWKVLHSFEGTIDIEGGDRRQAIAQIVARRPAT